MEKKGDLFEHEICSPSLIFLRPGAFAFEMELVKLAKTFLLELLDHSRSLQLK